MVFDIKAHAFEFIPENVHKGIVREIKRGIKYWNDLCVENEVHDILWTIESLCENDAQRVFLIRWAVREEISHIMINYRLHEWEIVKDGTSPDSLQLLDVKDNTDRTLVFVKPVIGNGLSPDFLITKSFVEYVWLGKKTGYDRQLCINKIAVVFTPAVKRQNRMSTALRKSIEEAYLLAGYNVVTFDPKDVKNKASDCVEIVYTRFNTPENTERRSVNHYKVAK